MTSLIVGSVTFGILVGNVLFSKGLSINVDKITFFSLTFLLFCVGLELGKNRTIMRQIRGLGIRSFFVPLGVAFGSIISAIFCGWLLGFPYNESAAIGAGFGWYSFSGIIIAQAYSVELGALAFLTNVSREVIAIILIPILAKFRKSTLIVAPGGATTMDTTLPLINRFGGTEAALLGLINGFILSMLVLILVPIFISM